MGKKNNNIIYVIMGVVFILAGIVFSPDIVNSIHFISHWTTTERIIMHILCSILVSSGSVSIFLASLKRPIQIDSERDLDTTKIIRGQDETQYVQYIGPKEELYIAAIKNLIKKVQYLYLHMDLDKGKISRDKFHKILDEEKEKYVISLYRKFDYQTSRYISQVLSEIKQTDMDEKNMCELFSINPKSIK